MTEQLSPAAQAVLDATGRKIWYRNEDIAAALRAVAKHLAYIPADSWTRVVEEGDLLAIAAELEQSN